MIQTLNVAGLKPEQIDQLQAMIAELQMKNQLDYSEPSTLKKEKDMIDYLTENPIKVDNLEFMKRDEIYDRI